MRTVTCYECGKKYNYDEDGFCPRCGVQLRQMAADSPV